MNYEIFLTLFCTIFWKCIWCVIPVPANWKSVLARTISVTFLIYLLNYPDKTKSLYQNPLLFCMSTSSKDDLLKEESMRKYLVNQAGIYLWNMLKVISCFGSRCNKSVMVHRATNYFNWDESNIFSCFFFYQTQQSFIFSFESKSLCMDAINECHKKAILNRCWRMILSNRSLSCKIELATFHFLIEMNEKCKHSIHYFVKLFAKNLLVNKVFWMRKKVFANCWIIS